MSSVLRHIKAIKLSAYESSIVATAIRMRNEEIAALRKWVAELLIVIIVTNYVSNFMGLITVTTFTLVSLYAHSGDGVSTATIFTVISTISLLADPLRSLGQQIGNIVSAAASWKRIEEFMLSHEQRSTDPDSNEVVGVVLEEDITLACQPSTRPSEIRFTDAAFGIEGKITLLRGINVDLVKPRLWMVVGRVGSVGRFIDGRCTR
jgi:ABC-type multidrug transport system fused ATPase/permease subunit